MLQQPENLLLIPHMVPCCDDIDSRSEQFLSRLRSEAGAARRVFGVRYHQVKIDAACAGGEPIPSPPSAPVVRRYLR